MTHSNLFPFSLGAPSAREIAMTLAFQSTGSVPGFQREGLIK